jgi:hypothetical protein
MVVAIQDTATTNLHAARAAPAPLKQAALVGFRDELEAEQHALRAGDSLMRQGQ